MGKRKRKKNNKRKERQRESEGFVIPKDEKKEKDGYRDEFGRHIGGMICGSGNGAD